MSYRESFLFYINKFKKATTTTTIWVLFRFIFVSGKASLMSWSLKFSSFDYLFFGAHLLLQMFDNFDSISMNHSLKPTVSNILWPRNTDMPSGRRLRREHIFGCPPLYSNSSDFLGSAFSKHTTHFGAALGPLEFINSRSFYFCFSS